MNQGRTLEDYKQTYIDLFGEMPPLPAGKFDFAEAVDPSFLLLAEEVRYQTFFSKVVEPKVIQLVCFALLLQQGSQAAQHHAVAARKLGASWDELWLMCKIASTVCGGLGPLNQGGAMLHKVKEKDSA